MRRALLVAAVPVAAATVAWGRLEQDPDWAAFVAVAGAGLVLVLVRRAAWRVAAAVAASLLVGLASFSVLPRLDRQWPGELAGDVWHGLQDADVVQSPYLAAARPELHAVLLMAVFGFAAALACAAAARKPLMCSALAVLAIGWPTATLGGDHPVATGVVALAVALWPPFVSSARSSRSAAVGVSLGAVVVLAAGVVAAAGVTPSAAAVTWRSWDLFRQPSSAAAVKLVWDSNYSGIEFPASKTTVLRIRAPRDAHYWRASTLDRFTQDRWIENLYPVERRSSGGTLPDDILLPRAARRPSGWVKQEVEVASLVDDHVVAASQPTRIESADLDDLYILSGGVVRSRHDIERRERYTVWSYAPSPTPEELAAVRSAYPPQLERYLELNGTIAPSFGLAGRDEAVDDLFTNVRYPALWPYRGVWEQAARITRGLRSPYEATVAIEAWLRSPRFTYQEKPPPSAGLPPLADFVERTRQGYCQQFAGTMALMLRFLGIPSRVAVGFTSGTWHDGVWTVSDRDAHAWVEVWFKGYGWLPFDPTPGRGTFSAAYTLASDSADAVAALGTGRFLTAPNFDAIPPSSRPVDEAAAIEGESHNRVLVLLFLALGIVLALGALKAARRLLRYANRDPRRLAVAARSEVVDYVRDQGVDVRAGAGPTELRAAIESRIGVPAGAFAESFSRARYGPPDAAAGASARAEAHRLVQSMRARLGPARRARGYFALRSLRRT